MKTRTVPQWIFETKDALKAARLGHEDACRELARTPADRLDIGNPNHPVNDGLFGHDRESFMAKQYRPTSN